MHQLTLAHFYPSHLNLYGDLGNIICLKYRANQLGIKLEVLNIEPAERKKHDLKNYDLFFMGGGQDSQQNLIEGDFKSYKGALIAEMKANKVCLAICGGYQLLGKSFQTSTGEQIEGLGIFAIETKALANVEGAKQDRLVGNVVAELEIKLHLQQVLINLPEFNLDNYAFAKTKTITGFENHSGRTYIIKDQRHLDDETSALAKRVKGFGNNAEDLSEGASIKNFFGTYLHGSFLPKNPHFADELIYRAMLSKYPQQQKEILDLFIKAYVSETNNNLEFKAHQKALSLS